MQGIGVISVVTLSVSSHLSVNSEKAMKCIITNAIIIGDS